MTLLEMLNRVGITEEEAQEVMRQEITAARRPLAALSPEQADFLARHGGIVFPGRTRGEEGKAVVLASLANTTALAATSISVKEAAERMGVDPSRIHHRIGDRALYAYKFGPRLRLPLWQFQEDGTALPSLRAVLTASPSELHPLSVHGFMTHPNSDLEIGDEHVSPVHWLTAGGEVQAVVALVKDIDVW
ncbi:MAG: hypothetical protein M3063_07995 [Actinomycetota bacterium]|nr:hypothetical protein [Actinomycetota bacterium]